MYAPPDPAAFRSDGRPLASHGAQTGKTFSWNSKVVEKPGKSPVPQRISASTLARASSASSIGLASSSNVDFGMLGLEPADPADQPGRREGRARVDDQKAPAAGFAHDARGAAENGETVGKIAHPRLPRFGQTQPAPVALDQGRADLVFELTNLLGDCRFGHEQFIGRPRERQMTRDGLERSQGVKRG